MSARYALEKLLDALHASQLRFPPDVASAVRDGHAALRGEQALITPPATPGVTPRIVIVMDGGLVQNVLADTLVEVVKVDYDVDGCDEDDGVVSLQDVDDNGDLLDGFEDAFITDIGAELSPGYVATRFRQCEEHNA